MRASSAVIAAIIITTAIGLTACGADVYTPPRVYPERGFTSGVEVAPDGTLQCRADQATVLLVRDGSVSHNGQVVKTVWDDVSITVSWGGTLEQTSGFATGHYGQTPFLIPESVRKEGEMRIDFLEDFKEIAPAISVTLCGGGM